MHKHNYAEPDILPPTCALFLVAGLMSSGCTAVTCYLESKKGRKILNIANVGDARAVLCKAGRAVRLTYVSFATINFWAFDLFR